MELAVTAADRSSHTTPFLFLFAPTFGFSTSSVMADEGGIIVVMYSEIIVDYGIIRNQSTLSRPNSDVEVQKADHIMPALWNYFLLFYSTAQFHNLST